MLITDSIFLFTAPLMTAPIYITWGPNVDPVCFQRTKEFYGFEEDFWAKELYGFEED